MGYILKTNLALRSNYGSARSTSKIKYIVIHYTANDGDTDEANAKYFKNTYRGASAHYFVDDDSVTRSVPDTYPAYSVGGARYSNYKQTGGAALYKICTNTNSLNIEMCDTLKNGKHDVSEKTVQNTLELVRYLMKKYNVPESRVIRHFDVTGKSCPAYYVSNTEWNKFKQRISSKPDAEVILNSGVYNHDGVDYSRVFNAGYYSKKYADLSAAFGTSATQLFAHFINNGMKEGRQASAEFNVSIYKNNYKDLQAAFGNDLPLYYKHYCENGYKENRKSI